MDSSEQTAVSEADAVASQYFADILTRYLDRDVAAAVSRQLVDGLQACTPPLIILQRDTVLSAVKAIGGIKKALAEIE